MRTIISLVKTTKRYLSLKTLFEDNIYLHILV